MKAKTVKTKVTARFIGRRTYEITIKQGERKFRKILCIPLYNKSIRFSRRIYEILEEALLNDYNLTAHGIYAAIKKEAYETEQSVPEFYEPYEMNIY